MKGALWMTEKQNLTERTDDQLWSSFLSEYPCGMLRCSHEEYPQVLSFNSHMPEFLGLTQDSPEWREFIQRNIFFMLPFEERSVFRAFLEKADTSHDVVEMKHRVCHAAGGSVPLTGWVRVSVDGEGKKEYHFLYMKLSSVHSVSNGQREETYQKLLQGIYDLLFRIDLADNTIACIYRGKQSKYKGLTGVRVVLNDLACQGFFDQVHKKDRENLIRFFGNIISGAGKTDRQELSSLNFRTISGTAGREYQMICAGLDHKTVLLCIKDITGERRTAGYGEDCEDLDIRERLKRGDGSGPARIISFHIRGERVYPDSSCRAMNYYGAISEERYELIRTEGLSLPDWMDQYRIPRHAYEQAHQEGEATLSDDGKNWGRRMYLSAEEETKGEALYTVLLLYISEREPHVQKETGPRVTIRTFGYFDVLVDDKPVIFRYEKSKEMLAVLVDRKGSFVANPYFISCLWEDEPYSEKVQGRCRQTAYRLMETLKQYGIEHIIEKVDGRRRIIPEMVDCDYFNYIQGKKIPGQQFNGAYLSDYSWGETTLSGLTAKR